jgi:DNA-binding PadR family transcriptional regulator
MPPALTLPDLVVLSLLAERPMHGYELNQELERRDVRDWAGVSRPQVYYSLRKLAESGLVARSGADARDPAGPERQIWRPNAAGRRALRQALGREEWATRRPPPPFLTWLALSPHAQAEDRLRVIRRRREFLEAEVARERGTLAAIHADAGPMVPAADLIVRLVIGQWELEIDWLAEVEAVLGGTSSGLVSGRSPGGTG